MNKKELKRRKRIIIKNKKLIKRYPWLIDEVYFYNLYPKSKKKWFRKHKYDYTEYDNVSKGWKRAFGDIMLEEYREVLKKHNYLYKFHWDQVKEKYGTLRLYGNFSSKELLQLESKYDYISQHICYFCGKANVSLATKGWTLPCCEKCYINYYIGTDYDECKQQEPLKNIVSYRVWKNGEEMIEKHKDYSETINKIMKRQKELFTEE